MAYTNRSQEYDNEKIENITDLEKLKKYLCPRCGHNPLACCECRGIRNCTAGQRAMALLDQQTEPETKNGNLNVDRAREKLRQALSSPDPVQWLLDNGTPSRHAAVEFVRSASIKYSDIVDDMKKSAPKEEKEGNGDLISVADFLKEAGLPSADESVTETDTESVTDKSDVEKDAFSLWLENKMREYEQMKEQLQQERSLLEEKIRAIDEKISRVSSDQEAIRIVHGIRSLEKTG